MSCLVSIYCDGDDSDFGEPLFYDGDGGGVRIPVRIATNDGSEVFRYVDPDSIKVDPTLRPNYDERFTEYYSDALESRIPVYYASVPIHLLVPFDLDYRPDKHPIGMKFIEALQNRWQQGNFNAIYAYQRGFWFVVSDDYISLFAAMMNNYETVVCMVMGELNHPQVTEFQLIPKGEVRSAFGLER